MGPVLSTSYRTSVKCIFERKSSTIKSKLENDCSIDTGMWTQKAEAEMREFVRKKQIFTEAQNCNSQHSYVVNNDPGNNPHKTFHLEAQTWYRTPVRDISWCPNSLLNISVAI